MARGATRTTSVSVLLAAATAAVVLLVPSPAGGAVRGVPGVPGPEIAAGVQTVEPEGVDTTDPEASDEDASGAPSWLSYVVIGVVTVGFLAWYVRRLQRQDSAGT